MLCGDGGSYERVQFLIFNLITNLGKRYRFMYTFLSMVRKSIIQSSCRQIYVCDN